MIVARATSMFTRSRRTLDGSSTAAGALKHTIESDISESREDSCVQTYGCSDPGQMRASQGCVVPTNLATMVCPVVYVCMSTPTAATMLHYS